MLLKRIGSSIVLTLILLGSIFIFPMPLVAIAIAAVTGIGLMEFYAMAEKKGFRPFKIYGIAIGVLLSTMAYIFHTRDVTTYILALILLIILVKHAVRKDGLSVIANSAITMLGILYVSFLFTFIIKIRFVPNDAEGRLWVTAFFIITKFSDIFAYFFGSKFGRHKLIPRISANKTIEGSISGVAGSILVGLLMHLWFLRGTHWAHFVFLGVLLGASGQIGDLIESLIKRDAGVKDSGRIAPGMGGVLDFIDSLLFAAPGMYIYMKVFIPPLP